ncbi:MAG: transglycosylase domain-containing protein [Candidatus Paceibacterota bacterium]
MKNKRFKQIRKILKERMTDMVIVGLVIGFIGAGGLLIFISTLDIPDLSAFEQRRVLQSTKIYDRTGEIVLYDLNQDVKRTVIPYETISHHIKNATVAIEDDTFFSHWGVRPLAIVRAFVHNFTGGDLRGQGGSTITQQVIKNALLSREKSYIRKIKEAILALRLEQILTKEEILWYYLNESPYGGTIYGVEEASQAFFGKPASEINLAEASYLAAIPQAPTYFSPHGNNRAALEIRKNRVLDQMLKLEFINQSEYDEAKATDVQFMSDHNTGIRAPHFVMYIRQQLAERYGEDELISRGLSVITTLDYELQEEAEKIVNEYALQNEVKFNASNAALVAMDPKTGDILTMVGSRDYFDEDIDGNYNIALAERQPGSSIKPFIYAKAFEKGYTSATTIFDLRTQFSTTCSPDNATSEDGCYSPSNYDNAFRGPVSIRNALAQSINIPAVKVLYLAGMQEAIKLARDAGLSTLTDWRRYGLTLVLGGGEVRLLDMVGAYSVFANEGVKIPTRSILRIEESTGNVIEDNETKQAEGQRVMDRDAALQISDILSDNVARTPLYGANSLLNFSDRAVASKTGTTNDRRDAWIIGYTPNLVVGAWAGNNDNRSMNEISGLIISPLWRAFMDVALEELPKESFASPAPIPSDLKPVLRSNGHVGGSSSIVGNMDNNADIGSLLSAMHENTHNILHFVNKDDPRGPYPSNPASDGQYYLWEYGVTIWKNNQFGLLFNQVNEQEINENPTEQEDDENYEEEIGPSQE